jgi:hypothetical protein
VDVVEAMAERAARGEMTLTELQAAVSVLLRDLACRQGPDGSVAVDQDDVVTRPNPTRSEPK